MLTPYAQIASSYLQQSWNILPLPEKSKGKPPAGYTGANGKDADEELALGEWLETAGNIALRLPKGVIGIDIDSYKDSGRTVAELTKRFGPLPESMGITSQLNPSDGATFYFSIPVDTKLKGSYKKIDVIHYGHRYSVAPPSIHPDGRVFVASNTGDKEIIIKPSSGRVYRWVSSSGLDLPWIPEPDSFPDLPEAWLNFFRKDEPTNVEEVAERAFVEPEPFEFEAGTACKKMNSMLKGAIIRLKEGKTGRHDAMVLTTWALTGEAAKGHTGYERVLEAYEKAWQKQFSTTEQEKRPLPLEFTSALRGAQRKIGMKEKECRCHLEAKVAPRQLKDLKMWR